MIFRPSPCARARAEAAQGRAPAGLAGPGGGSPTLPVKRWKSTVWWGDAPGAAVERCRPVYRRGQKPLPIRWVLVVNAEGDPDPPRSSAPARRVNPLDRDGFCAALERRSDLRGKPPPSGDRNQRQWSTSPSLAPRRSCLDYSRWSA